MNTIYADIRELIPEMTGPEFKEVMERMFS
jgi:hypothetical protein